VVKDVKYSKIRAEVPPTVYIPYEQAFVLSAEMTFLVRTESEPSAVMSAIRQSCLQLDNDVPLVNMQTEVDVIDRALYMERALALLSSSFGLLALLLASVGLYGTVAYSVSRRTNEIGIRMALGATRERILQMVITETCRLIFLGVVIGIPAAAASTRLLRSQLFQLSPSDPVAIASAMSAIILVSLIAGYLPAHRASRVDPMIALRCE
jgi:ABC-type antimicrobial peptide transport system permease subunit